MSNTATRLITLLMLLQREPSQKAPDLAEQLGVSVRSIHRYMAMLDEIGIPIYSERGPYGGFSLVRGYKMPPLVLSPEEAVAVYLGTSLVHSMWGKLYEDAARGAMAKLDNVLPEGQREEIAWARKTLATTGIHRPHLTSLAPRLELLRRSIRDQRRVRLVYRARNQPEQVREVDPYALVQSWGWWYVAGFCHLRGALRFFRLDRIVDLNELESTFERPEDFDIRDHLTQELQAPSQVKARLRFTREYASVAEESRALWGELETERDGSVTATLATPDLQWAASTILSFGPTVEVLEPEELRQIVGEWARAVAARYAPAEEHTR